MEQLNVESLFLSNIETAYTALQILAKDEAKTDSILQKYDILAAVKMKAMDDSIILMNPDSFRIIMNRTLFNTIVLQSITNGAFKVYDKYKNLESLASNCRKQLPEEDKQKTNKLYSNVYKQLNDLLNSYGIIPEQAIDNNAMDNALLSFGVQAAEDIYDAEDISEEELDDMSEALEAALEEFNNEQEDESEETEDENQLPTDEEDEQNEQDEQSDEPELPTEDDNEPKDRQELMEALYNHFGDQIDSTVTSVVEILNALYESGFNGMTQSGLLVQPKNNNDGFLITVGVSQGKYQSILKVDKGSFRDGLILSAIQGIYPDLVSYPGTKEDLVIPQINELIGKDVVCHELHNRLQKANIHFCTGKVSIRKWITETQLKTKEKTYANADEWIKEKNLGKTNLIKYKYVKSWYEWCIKNIILEALIDMNVHPSNDDSDALRTVLQAITKSIRNVIVVAERDIGEKIVIKIGRDKGIEIDQLIEALEDKLDIDGTHSVKVKVISERNGIVTLDILLKAAAEDKKNLFAAEILNKLIESGNAPSWSHCLLGKDRNGQYLFWNNFMDPDKAEPTNRIYSIFAGSRSGKGVMTSTLMAAALCDQKQIFYTDGKPENGATLGMIAWDEGKEAYVFDGMERGQDPFEGFMENYSKVRTPEEIAQYADKLPKSLFEDLKFFNTTSQREYLGLMRYMKSLSLCIDVIKARAAGTLDRDQWQVWVFDEMTKISNVELSIREKFYKYLSHGSRGESLKSKVITGKFKEQSGSERICFKGFKGTPEETNKNSEKYDAGVEYIYLWQEWLNRVSNNIVELKTKALGKADTNIIFIFQEADWINRNVAAGSIIAGVVASLPSTKIMGKAGRSKSQGGVYGDGNLSRLDWVRKVDNHGWWIISNGDDIRTSTDENAKLFKPYTVWTVPLNNGKFDQNGDINNPKYVRGYVTNLLSAFNLNPADVLQSAYAYAEYAVKTLDYASSLKEYIYDSCNFASSSQTASYDVLKQMDDSDGQGNSKNFNNGASNIYREDGSTFGNTSDLGNGVPFQNQQNIQDVNPLAQRAQRLADEQVAKNLKLLKAVTLMHRQYSDGVIQMYFHRNIANSAIRNAYNYHDRSNTSNTGLLMASIIMSNLYYCASMRGVYDLNQIVNLQYTKIANGQDTNNNAKYMLGMLEAYRDNRLSFDTMPSEEQLNTWAQYYSGIQDNQQQTNNQQQVFNQQQVNNQQMAQPINNMSQQPINQTYNNQQQIGQPMNNIGQQTFDNMGQTITSDDIALEDLIGDSYDESFDEDDFFDDVQQDNDNQGLIQRLIGNFKSPSEDMSVEDPCYQELPNGDIQLNPRPTQNVLLLPLNSYKEAIMPSYKTAERFKKALFERRTGTAYEFKERWAVILQVAKDLIGDNKMVVRFAITDNGINVNGIPIPCNDLIGSEYGITLGDIVRIHDTFKKFPMIKQLNLVGSAVDCLLNEYGGTPDSIWKAFRENRPLQTINIVYGDAQVALNRNNFAATIPQLENILGYSTLKSDMEKICAAKNPRLHEKSPGYKLRNMTNNSLQFVDNHPSVKKFAAGSAITGAIIGVGAIIGWPLALSAGIGALFVKNSRQNYRARIENQQSNTSNNQRNTNGTSTRTTNRTNNTRTNANRTNNNRTNNSSGGRNFNG